MIMLRTTDRINAGSIQAKEEYPELMEMLIWTSGMAKI